jgi:hypothetical protein
MPDGNAYFLVNSSGKPFVGEIWIYGKYQSVTVTDPMIPSRTGSVFPELRRRTIGGDNYGAPSKLSLHLQPGESRILRTFTTDVIVKPWRETIEVGAPISLTGTWNVSFLDGGPVLPKAYETADLKSWTTRDDPELKRFAGTAKYSITFEKPAVAGATDWTLDLGKVCESARVSINGKPVATLFANPFRVPVTDFLKDGENALEIEVTNLAANRIADMDRRKVNWKYFNDANVASHPNSRQRGVLDASNWPLFDSGLLGPVTLVPETVAEPMKK